MPDAVILATCVAAVTVSLTVEAISDSAIAAIIALAPVGRSTRSGGGSAAEGPRP